MKLFVSIKKIFVHLKYIIHTFNKAITVFDVLILYINIPIYVYTYFTNGYHKFNIKSRITFYTNISKFLNEFGIIKYFKTSGTSKPLVFEDKACRYATPILSHCTKWAVFKSRSERWGLKLGRPQGETGLGTYWIKGFMYKTIYRKQNEYLFVIFLFFMDWIVLS